MTETDSTDRPPLNATLTPLIQRHVRVGWVAMLLFFFGGLVLEALHGFKVDAYLGADNETRRHLWTLAHAHGTLLGLVNLAFAWTLSRPQPFREGAARFASRCFFGATILMPAGFFLGGVVFYGGDPGVGIALLPLGALLLIVATAITARQVIRSA
ncbi:hypothetical protein Poly30_07370 [Planctomycetes bacterium Poly30]|uniref:Uncharacterized protein n=1 Tax=Saltatorellus ferox TaxID=2528018 RepID=A0A518EMF1_9BACT|nr:hypothetical protein Poly30_07370 [Planctomycetes bacterium Poly30]